MRRSFGVYCTVGMGRGCYLSLFWALTMARTLARMTALKGSGRLGQAFTMSANSGEMAWFTVPRSCENAVFGADFPVCSPPLGGIGCDFPLSQRVAPSCFWPKNAVSYSVFAPYGGKETCLRQRWRTGEEVLEFLNLPGRGPSDHA